MSFPVRSGARVGLIRQYPGDLAACTVGALAAGFLVTVLPVGSALRIAVALPLVFFLPGYALTATLFPASARRGRAWGSARSDGRGRDRSRPGGIDTAERLACALALSIAIVPMAVIALAPTVGLATESIAGALAGVTVVLAQIGVLRRLQVPETERYTVSARGAFQRLRGEEGAFATASALVLVAGIVAAILALGVGMIAPQPAAGFTELGLYTEEDDDLVAGGFPDSIEPGESVPIVVAVENQEGQATNYSILVEEQHVENGTVENRTSLNNATLSLADGERTTTTGNVTPIAEEGTVRIAVLLYEGELGGEPVEDVYFWLEIGADDGIETVEESDEVGNETDADDEGADDAENESEEGDDADEGEEADDADDEGADDEGDADGDDGDGEDADDDGADEETDDDEADDTDEEVDVEAEDDDADEGDDADDADEDTDDADEEADDEDTDDADEEADDEDTDDAEGDDADDADDADDEGEDDDDVPDIFEEIFGDEEDE